MTKLIELKKVDSTNDFLRVSIVLHPIEVPSTQEDSEWNEWLLYEQDKLLTKASEIEDPTLEVPELSYLLEADLVRNPVVHAVLTYLETISSPYYKREIFARFDHTVSQEIYRCMKTLQLHWH